MQKGEEKQISRRKNRYKGGKKQAQIIRNPGIKKQKNRHKKKKKVFRTRKTGRKEKQTARKRKTTDIKEGKSRYNGEKNSIKYKIKHRQ